MPELQLQQVASPAHLQRMLAECAVEVAWSQNLVVVRTPPGCAHVVASALDRGALESVIGTVAGDDTLLVVVREGASARQVARQLRESAGLDPDPEGEED